MAERYVTLARHGKYDTEEKRPGGGDLISVGCEQAEYLAEALSQQMPITSMYSSTMLRAVSTADIIVQHLPGMDYTQDTSLVEVVFNVTQQGQKHTPPFYNTMDDTLTHQRIRLASTFDNFCRPVPGPNVEHDLVVCHGNIIRYFVTRALKSQHDLWSHITIYHCSLTRLLVHENGVVQLLSLNEISHLPMGLWTET